MFVRGKGRHAVGRDASVVNDLADRPASSLGVRVIIMALCRSRY